MKTIADAEHEAKALLANAVAIMTIRWALTPPR